jgi:4-amino-4-deoxy-L-arabinose transferase-like glycosyltransferase
MSMSEQIPGAQQQWAGPSERDLPLVREEVHEVAVPGETTAPQLSVLPQLSAQQVLFFGLALLVVGVCVALRLFQLDTIQSDFYGDIQIVADYVQGIQQGRWPVEFVLSAGPLYHYLITPITMLAGSHYVGLKLASVVVSLGVLAGTYAFARRLIDDMFALVALAVAGVSSWLLIFSRLGNSQILVALLVAVALWLVLRVAQYQRNADLVACAIVSALGLYVYPQSFVLPGVVWLTLVCLRQAGHPIRRSALLWFILISIACALPFAWLVYRDPDNFFSGYIGGKIIAEQSPLEALLTNMVNAALAFHVRGDAIFRSNAPFEPHLDPLSGALFLAGVVFWLLPPRRRWSPVLLVPFVLLQVPSVLVLGRPSEVPSASRTLGVAPLAYVLVASGIWWIAAALVRLGRRRLSAAVAATLVAIIVLLNIQRYFGDYVGNLPYHDTSIGQQIAAYADRLPPETHIYLAGCCWEEIMPETPYVKQVAQRPDSIEELSLDDLTCDQLQFLQRPAVLIWSFHDELPSPQIEPCRAWLPAQQFLSPAGLPVFNAAPIRPDLALRAETPAGDTYDERLDYTTIHLGAQTLGLRHSPIDMGVVDNLFDGQTDTLIRGASANPFVIELRFAEPRSLSELGLDLATMPRFRVTVTRTLDDGQTTSSAREFEGLPDDPHVDLELPGNQPARIVRVAIEELPTLPESEYHIHVRELQLR